MLTILALGSAGPARAQHPATNLLNWRTVYPERGIDFYEADFDNPRDRSIPWLHAPNDSVLFIFRGAYGGRLLRTTDRGLNWTTPSDVPPPAVRLTFFSAEQGLVSYDSSASLPARQRGQLRFTTDGAATWGRPRSAPTGYVHFTSPTRGYVVQPRAAGTVMVYTTTTAGLTWSVLDSLTGLDGITFSRFAGFPSANTAYLTGSYRIGVQPDSFAACVIQVRLGQGTWRKSTVPLPAMRLTTRSPFYSLAVSFTGDSVGAVVFTDGFPVYHFSTTTGGRTWTERYLFYADYGHLEVALAGPQHFLYHFALGSVYTDQLHSAFGIPAMPAYPAVQNPPTQGTAIHHDKSRLVLQPSGVGWVVGANGRIYRTTDFGATFTLLTNIIDYHDPLDMGFTDPSNGWILGKTDLLRTTDAGRTWAAMTVPPLNNTHLSFATAAFPDADTLALSCAYSTSIAVYYLLSSQNAGQTWSTFAIPGNKLVREIRFQGGARRAVAVGEGGLILRTTDGGLTWQTSVSGTTQDLTTLAWQDAQTVYALGNVQSGLVLKSTNGGASWQTITSPFPAGTVVVAFLTPQLGLVHAGTQLHRTTNGGATWQVVLAGLSAAYVWHDIKQKISFSSPQHGWYNGYITQDSGRTWTALPFAGTPAALDADNGFALINYTPHAHGYGSRVQRYSKHFLRAAPLANTTLRTGSSYAVAFTTEGTFLPAERDFRVELSNVMGRFRPGQTTFIGQGAASPIAVTLPANLPLGTRYRLRVVRADGSVLGADNGQALTLQRPTGLAPEAQVLAAPHLYPNPAQQAVTVAFADGPQAGRQVRLLDLTGRPVLLVPAPAAEARVSLAGVSAGCYLVEVRTPDGRHHTQRLVVQP